MQCSAAGGYNTRSIFSCHSDITIWRETNSILSLVTRLLFGSFILYLFISRESFRFALRRASTLHYCIAAGHVEPAALERARKELQTCSSGMVASLQVVRVNALTSAIIELDARLTGLRRSHYLRAIAASACETLECWFGVALVGYAFMLELRRAYWIVQVRVLYRVQN